MHKKVILFLGSLALVLSACQGATPSPQTTAPPTSGSSPAAATAEEASSESPIVFPKIDWNPMPMNFQRGKLAAIPAYDPDSQDPFKMDLRSYDLSGLDLRDSLDDLLFASFDDRTIWPSIDKMPEGFDPLQFAELGKNPGLNLRSLHQKGITGRGIGVAIIDQRLLVGHREYGSRLRLYEETEEVNGQASMHGPAVASIAVGSTVGVAPEADLYFIANALCNRGDFACLAKSIDRIIEINRQLPAERKIRVLSMSIGWGPESAGYDEITASVHAASDAGIFIICSSERDIYGFQFHGLGRLPTADPDDANSYEPGSWWAKYFYDAQTLSNTLLVPMDSRTTASPTGTDEYVFYREGGWSWSIPYIAGVYALAAQANPDITPDLFWSTALRTGRTIEITHENQEYSFGVIMDPVALIHALQDA